MFLHAKTSLRLQQGSFPNIMDIGDYYVANGQILKKDLTVASLANTFDFRAVNGEDQMPPSVCCVYTPSTKQATHLMLKGSGAQISGFEYQQIGYTNLPPSSYAQFDSGEFGSYFDSQLGTTAGKRYVFINNSASSLDMGEVKPDGTVAWIFKAAQNPNSACGGYTKCLGESNQIFYCYLGNFYAGTTNGAQCNYVVSINKVTGAIAPVCLNNSGHHKYLGTSTDRKLWFSSAPGGTSTQLTLTSIDLNSNISYSSALSNLNTTTATVGLSYPSALSVVAENILMTKLYVVSDPVSVTGNLIIKTCKIPVAGMATSVNFEFPTLSLCTLTGAPTIGVPYTKVVATDGHASVTECWTFKDGLNEYVAIAYHAAMDQCSPTYNRNLCSVDIHAIYVFLIDPLDHTNLIYKSTVRNNGFNSSTTTSIMLKARDGKTLIAACSLGFSALLWDTPTESYINGPWNALPLMNIHLDNNNQLFIRDSMSNVSVFSVKNSRNIVVSYDVPSITYTGVSADANALLSSYDFMGARQVVVVKLQIVGAVFTANSSTIINITTSSIADTIVPITITSSGNVTITPVL